MPKKRKAKTKYEFTDGDRAKGGEKVAETLGAEHMKAIASNGGKTHSPEHMREISQRGVQRRRELIEAGKAALAKKKGRQ